MRLSVFIATSVDGFIARLDGSIDWLVSTDYSDPQEDYGYREFTSSIDAIVMGRNTYESVLLFEKWPYDIPVFVLSSHDIKIPSSPEYTITHLNAAPEEVVKHLENLSFQNLYIDGGKTIQRFLYKGLIDEMIITRIPILIGNGIPLFGPLPYDLQLHHIVTRQFKNGFVQSRYEVKHVHQ